MAFGCLRRAILLAAHFNTSISHALRLGSTYVFHFVGERPKYPESSYWVQNTTHIVMDKRLFIVHPSLVLLQISVAGMEERSEQNSTPSRQRGSFHWFATCVMGPVFRWVGKSVRRIFFFVGLSLEISNSLFARDVGINYKSKVSHVGG